MKTLLATIAILICSILSLAQTSRFFTPGKSTYTSQFVPTPLDADAIMKAGAKRQAAYDQNQKYIDALIDWIYDIKAKTNDRDFHSTMDTHYKKLRSFDGKDLSLMRDQIRQVELGIKEEIDKYNSRINNPALFWEKGNEDLKNHNYSSAITNFDKAIELSQKCSGCYLNKGYAYQMLGSWTKADENYSTFIELESNNAIGYRYRGWAKYYLNDFTSSIADFNKQIELEPTGEAYYNRGSAKSELNDHYGAISDYKKAIELKPDFSMAYNNRGWSKYELKKYSEALKDINKSIELDPTNWVAFDSRQEIKFSSNDLKGCIEDCNTAISLNPKVSNSYFFRGRAYYKQGNKTKACEDWSKAGELGHKEAYEFISKYCNN